MTILITGICGFAGSSLALRLREIRSGLEIFGIDNFVRPGSELNRSVLQAAGIRVLHGDVRLNGDFAGLPAADWVIDAAAQPSVLAGAAGSSMDSLQLMQHNLEGTIHTLEFCRRHKTGFMLLSTSRVYSIAPLATLKMEVRQKAFRPVMNQSEVEGLSEAGVAETFPTAPPVSLYGASKLCSETLALEYGYDFKFPVWINRLGVLAGAGQFGRADQGIFSFWIHSCASRRPVRFIGFGGEGHQVRDCLHPRDLAEVFLRQMESTPSPEHAITNFGGGISNCMSLRQLHEWCESRFGPQKIEEEKSDRPFDVPWMVLDSSAAKQRFHWKPRTPLQAILEEIADHAEKNPDWLDYTCS